MNIQTRIAKLEGVRGTTSGLCNCADAIAFAATPYFNSCIQCGKEIDLKYWKSWDMLYPKAERQMFAFALARNDEKATRNYEIDGMIYEPSSSSPVDGQR